MPTKARLRDANAYEAKLLDPVNLRVLAELVADGRIAMVEEPEATGGKCSGLEIG